MATIVRVADIHAAKVVDESRGYPHIRKPIVAVEINFGLSPADKAKVKRTISGRDKLSRFFGSGAWHFTDMADMLTVRHTLKGNRYGARTTAAIAEKSLATVNEVLASL